jgi:hypothetical protein
VTAEREVARRTVGLREKGVNAEAMVAVRARAAATFMLVVFDEREDYEGCENDDSLRVYLSPRT